MKVGGKPQIGLLPYENSELVNRVLHILGLGGGGGSGREEGSHKVSHRPVTCVRAPRGA